MTPQREAESILETIRAENPHFWPFGLDRRNLEGGCWLMRKSSSREPVGFVGWQNRPVDGKNVGFYAVGVLPEHRRQGYAEQAIRQVMNEKRATVDEVRAFIVPDNKPSLELAKKLGVPVQHKTAACRYLEKTPDFGMDGQMTKQGGVGDLLRMLFRTSGQGFRNPTAWSNAGKAVGTAGAYDALLQSMEANKNDRGFWDQYLRTDGAGTRLGQLGFNALIARTGIGADKTPGAFAAAAAGMPAKDVAIGLLPSIFRLPKVIDKYTTQGAAPTGIIDQIKKLAIDHPIGAAVAGVGGAGLLGLAGVLGYKGVKAVENMGQQGSRLRVTLPTRNPGDQETTIEMPFNAINLTPTAVNRVTRDLRRRLRAEGKSRTGRKSLADQAVVLPGEEQAGLLTS